VVFRHDHLVGAQISPELTSRDSQVNGITKAMATDYTTELPPMAQRAGPWTIGAIFAGESLLRALNVSVIPIQAFELLGSSQRVSILATVVSFIVLFTTLSLPYLLRGVRRRWVYTLGIACVMAAALAFAANHVETQVLGAMLRNIGASIMNITLSLYIMDNIAKSEMTTSEPVRMTVATFSWVLGPAIGTWLYTHFGILAPQAAAFIAGVILLIGFWTVRLRDNVTLQPGTLAPFNPLSNVKTFIKQPRLRLAWCIAFGRSCFWSSLFIYGPLLMIEGGIPKSMAGYLVPASQLTLPFTIFFGWLAKRIGVRRSVAGSFLGIAVFAAATGWFGKGEPWFAAAFLMIAAICASGLDGVGGIPFYRSVKPHQRQRMTSVYRTFFECAELIPGFLFMLLLLKFEIGIVFIVIACLSIFLAALTWKHLPKSM
jgi:MFS family permease